MQASAGGRVVVITGASSGIGRATAHAFAREGACVVLAAREPEALEDAAGECRAQGAEAALAVPTDVADEGAVAQLADHAVAVFGRIDVWVNNAGVVALGRFDQIPPDVFRQVIDVNFFGCVHGARAALRVFRRQGQGVLINMASILGVVSEPYASPYVASKFAVRGLSESLRQEVQDLPGIRVCTVLPTTMDTPTFDLVANYTPWRVKAVDPAYDPATTARQVVRLAHSPRREVVAGSFGHLFTLGMRLVPGWMERAVGRIGPWLQFVPGTRAPAPTEGNLFVPAAKEDHALTGGWRERSTRPLLLLAGGGLLLAAALTWQAWRTVEGMRAEARVHRLRRQPYR